MQALATFIPKKTEKLAVGQFILTEIKRITKEEDLHWRQLGLKSGTTHII